MSRTKMWAIASSVIFLLAAMATIYDAFLSGKTTGASVTQVGISTSGANSPVTGVVNGSVPVKGN